MENRSTDNFTIGILGMDLEIQLVSIENGRKTTHIQFNNPQHKRETLFTYIHESMVYTFRPSSFRGEKSMKIGTYTRIHTTKRL